MSINRGLYKHFKGNYYQVVDTAKDSETQQQMVIYRALYGNKDLWLRPLEVFNQVIEHAGVKQPRFTLCANQSEVLELVSLDIVEGCQSEFEQAFEKAQVIIRAMPGYISHQLKRCIEPESRYILLVEWQRLEDSTVVFRGSDRYQRWRELLDDFFDETPSVQHCRELSSQ